MADSDSDPLVPPAKRQTITLPRKPKPLTPGAPEQTAPEPAPVAIEPIQNLTTPLEAVDKAISDEADRLMEQGAPPPEPSEQEEATVIRGQADQEQPEDSSRAPAAEPSADQAPLVPAVEPIAPADQAEAVQLQREPAGGQVKDEPGGSQLRQSLFKRVFGAIIAAITFVLWVFNAPVHMLPDRAKTVVNWIAISLLLWVPAIWYIALFVI